MTLEEIKALVAGGESDALEFKDTTGARREAAHTICAMLNQNGGYVIFGISEKGRMTGQQTAERTLEKLSAAMQEIKPPVSPKIEKVRIGNGRDILVVRVDPGEKKPYFHRGTAYRRVGNTTLEMPSDDYTRMLMERVHNEQRWENQLASGWSLEDLDMEEIDRTSIQAIRAGRLKAHGQQEPVEVLRSMGLTQNDGTLLRAAVVLFGKADRIEREFPQCTLRVARIRGTYKEFLDNRQFHGNAFYLFACAERFLHDTLPIAGRFEEGRMERVDTPLYPPAATREALANALCHRDYVESSGMAGLAVFDDRLEVSSPGGLHFGLTPQSLFEPHQSRPWNPLIARVFYRRGIIEKWGSGTIKMANEMEAAKKPPPVIEDSGGFVTVCFRQGPEDLSEDEDGGLTERQQAILTMLHQEAHGLALREIRRRFPQVTDWLMRRDLETLRQRGLVMTTGKGRGARWKHVRNDSASP